MRGVKGLPASMFAATSVAAVLYAGPAWAYLDPGTGSMLLQGVIGAIAAVAFTLKLYWHKFTGLFKRNDRPINRIRRRRGRAAPRTDPPHERRACPVFRRDRVRAVMRCWTGANDRSVLSSRARDAMRRAGLREPLLILALLLFTVGVSLPAVLYFNNAKEFSITLADLLWVSVPAFLVCLAIGAALVWALPFLRRPRPVALLFVATLLLWFHGNVVVWQYGPLDGRAIDWNLHRQKGVIDAGLWGLALALAMWEAEADRSRSGFSGAIVARVAGRRADVDWRHDAEGAGGGYRQGV